MNQASGEMAHTHDPDLGLKSEVLGQSNFFAILFPSYSNCPAVVTLVPSEVDEADGNTDMSLCPLISIWLRPSIVTVSNPTNYPMSSKEILLLQLPHHLTYVHRRVWNVHLQMAQSDAKGGAHSGRSLQSL